MLSPQRHSDDELLIIMLNYYGLALNGSLPHEESKDPQQLVPGVKNNQGPGRAVYARGPAGCSMEQKLARLNRKTISECVKQVLSGINMYLEYYKQASTLPIPMTHPRLATMKGSRALYNNVGFESGRETSKAMSSFNERYNII